MTGRQSDCAEDSGIRSGQEGDMLFRELNNAKCKTYLLASEGMERAVIIDPVKDRVERYLGVLAYHRLKLDLIIDTLAVSHDLEQYLDLLKRDGALVLVGAPPTPHPSPNVFSLLFRRRSLAGSGIGGIPETQEMLDFCAAQGIVCDVEVIGIQQINVAYERMLKSDVKYRFVIDMASLKA